MLEAIRAEDEMVLVTQAQHGDREAFGMLVCRHRAGMINGIYRMCGDAQLAEDAAQVALIRAWQRLPDYRPGGSFRSWLYRIAINTALDSLRREKQAEDIDDLQLAEPEVSGDSRLEKEERIRKIRQAIMALPEASRAVLILREYEALTYQEIAQTLDIPTGTVMSRLNYARKWLAERLQFLMEEA